jgi:hypothetical protein
LVVMAVWEVPEDPEVPKVLQEHPALVVLLVQEAQQLFLLHM